MRLTIIVLMIVSKMTFASNIDCSGTTNQEQFDKADIVFVGRLRSSFQKNQSDFYELEVLRRWKGHAENVVLRGNRWGPGRLEKSEYYLFFLTQSDTDEYYWRRPCHHLDLVLYSGEMLVELGEPAWRSPKE